MGGLSIEFQAVIKHTEYTVNDTDIISRILKDWALLDMCLKVILIIFRRETILLISFEPGFFQRLAESACIVKNALRIHHVFILELAADIFRQIIVAHNSGTHHCRWIERTFLICPDHRCKRMLMRNVVLRNGLKYLHRRHDT